MQLYSIKNKGEIRYEPLVEYMISDFSWNQLFQRIYTYFFKHFIGE